MTCLAVVMLTACGTTSQTNSPSPQSATSNQQSPTSQPAGQATSNANKQDWEIEWEKTIELAKQEGEVTIIGSAQTDREDLMREFEKAYPGIKVKYFGMSSSESGPKIQAEQQQGKYLTDIVLESGGAAQTDDIHNYIILPEVKDDKNWNYGYEKGFEMAQAQYTGQFVYANLAFPYLFINNDVIPEGEIKTFDDLLDPKYKGKFIINDFSKLGQGHVMMTALYMSKGEEFINKLMAQEPILVSDPRQVAEWFATGKYAIGIGVDSSTLGKYKDQGIVKKVSKLEPEKSEYVGSFALTLLKNPPHPNATKVFLNWFFGKEGQTHFVNIVQDYISRRTDVPLPPVEGMRGWDKIDYKMSSLEQKTIDARPVISEIGAKAKQAK